MCLKAHLHHVVSLWIATLIVLVARIAFAQITPASQPYAPAAVSTNASPMTSSSALFLPAVAYASGGSEVFSLAVGDINADGKADLIVANSYACPYPFCSEGSIGVLLGLGNGTFLPAMTYGSGGRQTISVAVADVNGDGKPDVIAANFCSIVSNCSNGTVSVFLGNGDGSFQAAAIYDSNVARLASSVAIADVNGDSKSDVLVASGAGVNVLLGNGDGTFQLP